MKDNTNTQVARTLMGGKPVLVRENTRTILTDKSEEFGHKLLCDNLTFNLGDACAFSCQYCYVEAVARRFTQAVVNEFNTSHSGEKLGFQDVVIRRKNALKILAKQLVKKDGSKKYANPDDRRVIYSSTLVDVAANLQLLEETAEACTIIFEHTGWQIRLLSKSSLLARLPTLIPEKFHQRLILGFSTGTLDDRAAKAIELGTALISHRIKALYWLQDRGFRTFGMICPSLPQSDYDSFSRDVTQAIRADRCEHVWAEPINVRAEALPQTIAGLRREGLDNEAARLMEVHGPESQKAWEDYARQTFLAHTKHVPSHKLRFLQYVTANSAQWWGERRHLGAVPIGKIAKIIGLCAHGPSAPPSAYR
jgi:DNA repair photolyase